MSRLSWAGDLVVITPILHVSLAFFTWVNHGKKKDASFFTLKFILSFSAYVPPSPFSLLLQISHLKRKPYSFLLLSSWLCLRFLFIILSVIKVNHFHLQVVFFTENNDISHVWFSEGKYHSTFWDIISPKSRKNYNLIS